MFLVPSQKPITVTQDNTSKVYDQWMVIGVAVNFKPDATIDLDVTWQLCNVDSKTQAVTMYPLTSSGRVVSIGSIAEFQQPLGGVFTELGTYSMSQGWIA